MDNVAYRNAPRARTGPPVSSSPPGGRQLAEHHARYLQERGVTLEVAKAAGYWTAGKPSEIPPAFSAKARRRHPALIAPHYSPDLRRSAGKSTTTARVRMTRGNLSSGQARRRTKPARS